MEYMVEASSSLMQGQVGQELTVQKLPEKHRKSPAQSVRRGTLQLGVVTIPKSARQDRIAENADIFDFALTKEDMQLLNALGEGKRLRPDPNNFDF